MDAALLIQVLQLINTGISMAETTDPVVAEFAAELHQFALKAKAANQQVIDPSDVALFLKDRYAAAKAALDGMLAAPVTPAATPVPPAAAA